jgi:hypothetical protein
MWKEGAIIYALSDCSKYTELAYEELWLAFSKKFGISLTQDMADGQSREGMKLT